MDLLEDLDNDGVEDFIVSPGQMQEGTDTPFYSSFYDPLGKGFVRVYSGKTGEMIYSYTGNKKRQWLGYSVSSAGDANKDGRGDFMYSDSQLKKVVVRSGADGSVLYTYNRDSGSCFGCVLSAAGDVNNDGYGDFIITNQDAPNGGFDESGYVNVYSGKNGSVIHHFAPMKYGVRWGVGAAPAGDVDKDGYDDVVFSTLENSGYLRIHSGKNGNLIHKLNQNQSGRCFGGVGDINGDGYGDIFTSANEEMAVEARVYSGKDKSLLLKVVNAADEFTDLRCFDRTGDLSGDGVKDIVLGSDFNGDVRVISPVDGSLVYRIEDNSFYSEVIGYGFETGGDFNGDGVRDLALRVDHADLSGTGYKVWVYSGKDWSRLASLDETDLGSTDGSVLASVKDLNGDGRDELVWAVAEGASTSNTGRVVVFSGGGHSKLLELQSGDSSDNFGHAVADIGDVNGDGVHDIAVGAPAQLVTKGNMTSHSGGVYVFSGENGTLLYNRTTSLCDGLGESLAVMGDLNGDGVSDFAVGTSASPNNSNINSMIGGCVDMLSGVDGSSITVVPAQPGSDVNRFRLGKNLITPGDLDGDGWPDLVSGDLYGNDRYNSKGGAVVFITGPNWSSFDYKWNPTSSRPYLFGEALAPLSDLDGDGVSEVAAGDRELVGGAVVIFSGASHKKLYDLINTDFTPGYDFGADVGSLGDLNGDGLEDMAIGAPDNGAGGEVLILTPQLTNSGAIPYKVRFGSSIKAARSGRKGKLRFTTKILDEDTRQKVSLTETGCVFDVYISNRYNKTSKVKSAYTFPAGDGNNVYMLRGMPLLRSPKSFYMPYMKVALTCSGFSAASKIKPVRKKGKGPISSKAGLKKWKKLFAKKMAKP